MLYLLMAVVSSAMVSILMRISEEYGSGANTTIIQIF